MSQQTVALIIGIATVLILIWDAFLYTDKVERNSITQVTIDLSRKYPIVPFLWGFLMGHFFG